MHHLLSYTMAGFSQIHVYNNVSDVKVGLHDESVCYPLLVMRAECFMRGVYTGVGQSVYRCRTKCIQV